MIEAYMRSVAERRGSGSAPADPTGGVPDRSGSGSEEIAMKEEVVEILRSSPRHSCVRRCVVKFVQSQNLCIQNLDILQHPPTTLEDTPNTI